MNNQLTCNRTITYETNPLLKNCISYELYCMGVTADNLSYPSYMLLLSTAEKKLGHIGKLENLQRLNELFDST